MVKLEVHGMHNTIKKDVETNDPKKLPYKRSSVFPLSAARDEEFSGANTSSSGTSREENMDYK